MTYCTCTMTLLVDLPGGRTVPVTVEYVQSVTPGPDHTTYDLLGASLDLSTLRTLTLCQAEEAIRLAKAQFMTKTEAAKGGWHGNRLD